MAAGGGAPAPATETSKTGCSDPISDDETGNMEEVTYVDPCTWESERTRASRTTKGGSKRRSMTAVDKCTHRMKKLHHGWEKERAEREAEFRLDCKLPERDFPLKPFEEQQFGTLYAPDNGGLCGLSEEVASRLSASVVSLALFDDKVMLFACTGIALRVRTAELRRFLTSAHLVDVFRERRNKEDKLNIIVLLPTGQFVNGFVELYDEDIAIITSATFTGVCPIDGNTCMSEYTGGTEIVAAGRSFSLGDFRATTGMVTSKYGNMITCCMRDIKEAALGGPVVDVAGNVLGVNIRFDDGNTYVLRWDSVIERLHQFRLLNYNRRIIQQAGYLPKECRVDPNPHVAGSSTGETETSTQEYSLPPGAKRITPSGFLRKLNNLVPLGYPEPPPLMVEMNGVLIHKFEEFFGYLHSWSGYDFNRNIYGEGMNAWARLDGKIITSISRRVVSLSSYNGFLHACTGLLIKWRANTVILTSASLVRTCDNPDTIDDNLRIEVFLPPNQHVTGKLESYDSHHNIAIVSFKGLYAIRPEDIFHLKSSESRPGHVVAIGREPSEGLLCASTGKLTKEPITALPCKHLKLSTCEIKKAGIGGPLINFDDGSFIGMNFYDGKTKGTPFLPRSKNLEVLSGPLIIVTQIGRHHLEDQAEMNNTKRWPVPQAYWYNSVLKEDWAEGRKFMKFFKPI